MEEEKEAEVEGFEKGNAAEVNCNRQRRQKERERERDGVDRRGRQRTEQRA